MTMKFYKLVLPALAGLISVSVCHAGEYVIVVNKENSNVVDKEFVGKVYRGETKSWKDGSPVVAYDLPDDNSARSAFLADVVGKTQAQVKSMWASLTFSGKALPPKAAGSDSDVINAVAGNKNAIGYVLTSPTNSAVKVVK